jgi:hypothetical protein
VEDAAVPAECDDDRIAGVVVDDLEPLVAEPVDLGLLGFDKHDVVTLVA